ncbi:MAG: hypothetical protein KBS51_06385, partial [Lachnospiraceae bacterium]|nr:hypothetical protein [Candidatus Darwinimomas equi]
SFAQIVKTSTIAAAVAPEKNNIDETWNALKGAQKARLQLTCPVSSVQMEYLYHVKPDKLKTMIQESITYCRSLTEEVEFVAQDATRSDRAFLYEVIDISIKAGAKYVTVCDDAGNMLPDEYKEFLNDIRSGVSGIDNVEIGIWCCNKLSVADTCSLTGVLCGADEIKTSVHSKEVASLKNIVKIFGVKGDTYNVSSNVKTVELKRIYSQIDKLFAETKSKTSPFEDGVRDEREDKNFTANDGIEVIVKEIENLGYDLTDEDNKNVYDAFVSIAAKKENVSSKELEAIIASNARRVPPTYKIKDYIINSGNVITATSHMRLEKDGKILESVSIGDGPVDASFLAIEQITGHHYELDDFQIQAITEGREAMGETIVKLRSGGKLYSGRGISTDVVGSSILAYINALNKIVYEEEN